MAIDPHHDQSHCPGPLGGAPVRLLANSRTLQTVLYRCATCDALWYANDHFARQIDIARASRDYPEAFSIDVP